MTLSLFSASRFSLLARSLVLCVKGWDTFFKPFPEFQILERLLGMATRRFLQACGIASYEEGWFNGAHRVMQRWGTKDNNLEWGVAPKLEVNPWATVHDHCQAHLTHDHPKSMVSGVYYVKTPQGSGPITLYDARMMFNEPIVIHPRPGELILFPSWLSHQVMPTAVEGDQRMSIALNAPGYWPATMNVGASYGLSTNAGNDQEGGGAADVVYP